MLFLPREKSSDRPTQSRSTSCQGFKCFNRVETNVVSGGSSTVSALLERGDRAPLPAPGCGLRGTDVTSWLSSPE